jgi:hypothetical protein
MFVLKVEFEKELNDKITGEKRYWTFRDDPPPLRQNALESVRPLWNAGCSRSSFANPSSAPGPSSCG